MKKPNTTTGEITSDVKLTPADWQSCFGTLQFDKLSDYSIEYLRHVLKASWQWFLDHQLCMYHTDVERFTRARKAIQSNIMRRE